MVVDGSRVSRKLVTKALMSELLADTVEIAAVGSAEVALELIAAEKFDLITSSLLLPDLYGLDLCRAVRHSGLHRFTPFIVITAEPHTRLMKNGFNAGVTDYYDKTQGYKNLIGFIRAFVERNAPLKGKVLYLEDNLSEAKYITEFMRRRGLEVVHSVSAEHALEILDRSFDMVVLDFYLEGDLSGGDFLHIVRCGLRRSLDNLPVLVITADEDPEIQPEIFHAGGNEFVTKPVMEEVLIAKLRSLMQLKRQSIQIHKQAEEIRNLGIKDKLTGTFNRQYFLDHAQRFLDETENYPVWMAFLELDDFSTINDGQGILVGDQVLQSIGELLRKSFHKKDVIARTGSKEFMIMMMRRSHEECVTELEELRNRIECLQPAGYLTTASIGVASNLGHTHISFDELWAEANRAMYRARERGRNQVVSPGGLRSSDRMLLRANHRY